VGYRPALIGRAPAQFSDLMGDKAIYDALMERIIQLADAPWDAWPVYPGGDEAEFRKIIASANGCAIHPRSPRSPTTPGRRGTGLRLRVTAYFPGG
jgi:hypothetical protein